MKLVMSILGNYPLPTNQERTMLIQQTQDKYDALRTYLNSMVGLGSGGLFWYRR